MTAYRDVSEVGLVGMGTTEHAEKRRKGLDKL